MKHALLIGCALAAWSASPCSAENAKILRVVPHSNLTILDPVWTTAYITRNHGYMIYDTLFGTDEQGAVRPQMVEKWSVSEDKLVYTFTLRAGLAFHDGAAVTSEDAVASIARWGKRDVMGQALMAATDRLEKVDARTFRLTLKAPYALVLESLGKTSSHVPFVMPKRVADTPADRQIESTIGSGPFMFQSQEWKPGERVVYVKNPKYVARSEPASGTAGGKLAKLDRVEWLIVKDSQTQVNALAAGEVDMIESVPFELYAGLKARADIRIVNYYPVGFQAFMRMNHLQPPFNNAKVRQAALAAMNQTAVLRAQVGVPELYAPCASIYPCKTAYANERGLEALAKPNMKRARQLLGESGYDGTPVVLMQQTDLAPISKTPVVVAQLLRQAGFKVDLQAMDWQTLVSRRAKKDPPARGGWSAFVTWGVAADLSNPVSNNPLNAACEDAWFGWPCDSELQALRARFARTADEPTRKSLAEAIQVRAAAVVTHVPLGEYQIPAAARRSVSGVVIAPALVAWNISKSE